MFITGARTKQRAFLNLYKDRLEIFTEKWARWQWSFSVTDSLSFLLPLSSRRLFGLFPLSSRHEWWHQECRCTSLGVEIGFDSGLHVWERKCRIATCVFAETAGCFPKWPRYFTFPSRQHWSSSFPASSPTLAVEGLLDASHPPGWGAAHCRSGVRSPNSSWQWLLFLCLLVPPIPSLVKWPQISCPFCNWVICVFLLLSCKSFLTSGHKSFTKCMNWKYSSLSVWPDFLLS